MWMDTVDGRVLQVVEIMAGELNWSSAEQRKQLEEARKFIDLVSRVKDRTYQLNYSQLHLTLFYCRKWDRKLVRHQ